MPAALGHRGRAGAARCHGLPAPGGSVQGGEVVVGGGLPAGPQQHSAAMLAGAEEW
jgi:hypothetical protein